MLQDTTARGLHIAASVLLMCAAFAKEMWWALVFSQMDGDISDKEGKFIKFVESNYEDAHMRDFAEGSPWFFIWIAGVLVLSSSSHEELQYSWFNINDESTWYSFVAYLGITVLIILAFVVLAYLLDSGCSDESYHPRRYRTAKLVKNQPKKPKSKHSKGKKKNRRRNTRNS